jgi:hypothetical protein
MRIRVTWEGNADGAVRMLTPRGSGTRLWVTVLNGLGHPARRSCKLTCEALDTKLMHVLAAVVARIGGKAREPAPVEARPVHSKHAEFVVPRLPRRSLPYWLLLRAERSDIEVEETRVFVVPSVNYKLSMVFVGVFALLATYTSWLWLRLTAESSPNGLASFAGTGSAVLGPLAALVAPVFSMTARRFIFDSLVSGSAACVALVLATCLHHMQAPVYVENNTPGAINALGGGRRFVLEPGAAAVLPYDELDGELQALLDCPEGSGKSCDARSVGWFGAGQYCKRNGETEHALDCLELRASSLISRLQRWLAFSDRILIGCKSVSNLDSDGIDAWKRSGSCKHDPELKFTRSLRAHLERVAPDDATEEPASVDPCTQPAGEVIVRPFRQHLSQNVAKLQLQPIVRELFWPSNLDAQDAVPSWRFTSNEPLAEVRSSVNRGADGTLCPIAYPVPCKDDRPGPCQGLYSPRGEVSVLLEHGDQGLGRLWCSNRAERVFATRLMSRLVAVTVFGSGRRPVSHFESLSEAPGGWVAWCEPNLGAGGAQTDLEAEVILPQDWQPVPTWSWALPGGSRVTRLELVVAGTGRWGTLVCDANDPELERTLSLLEAKGPRHRAVASASNTRSRWSRYGESSPFHSWAWRCTNTEGGDGRLDVEMDDGTAGELTASGEFNPWRGDACAIDPVTIQRVHGVQGDGVEAKGNAGSARHILTKFRVPNCNPASSWLRTSNGAKP